MNNFLKELMKLATELNQAEGFNAVAIINEMELLYDKHVAELKQEFETAERQRVSYDELLASNEAKRKFLYEFIGFCVDRGNIGGSKGLAQMALSKQFLNFYNKT